MKENPLRKYCGKFSQIESKLKEWPIIGMDTEDNSKGTVTLFGFFGANGPYVTRFYKKAISYIYGIEEATYFVAHNLEYDVVNFPTIGHFGKSYYECSRVQSWTRRTSRIFPPPLYSARTVKHKKWGTDLRYGSTSTVMQNFSTVDSQLCAQTHVFVSYSDLNV